MITRDHRGTGRAGDESPAVLSIGHRKQGLKVKHPFVEEKKRIKPRLTRDAPPHTQKQLEGGTVHNATHKEKNVAFVPSPVR